MKYIYCIFAVVLCSAVSSAAEPLKVVTTLSTFADLVKQVGGDLVEVSSVASAKFNTHFIEARPSDVLKLKRCDLFIHGGLDLEAWRGPLVDAAARGEIRVGGERELDLSKGIQLLEIPNHDVSRSEGDIHLFGNPHYWTDPNNALIIARSIESKLAQMRPDGAAQFQANLDKFAAAINQEMTESLRILAAIKGREVIAYHNEWVYLLKFAGLKGGQFLEPKPGIPPTPKHVEFLTQYIKSNNVLGIIQASYYPTDVSEKLAKDTSVKFALLCQNVNEFEDCDSYQALLKHNTAALIGLMQ